MVSSPVTRPVVAHEAVRAFAVDDRDAFGLGVSDLLGVGWDLFGGFERDDCDVEDPGAHGGAGHVEGGRHAAPGVFRRAWHRRGIGGLRANGTPGLGAQSRAGSVERDVATTHDDDALAELGLVAAVDVEEELDGAQDSVEIMTGQIEVAAPPGAYGDEERAMLVEQVLDRGVVLRRGTRARRSIPSSTMAPISRSMSERERRYSGMPSTIIPPSRSAAS